MVPSKQHNYPVVCVIQHCNISLHCTYIITLCYRAVSVVCSENEKVTVSCTPASSWVFHKQAPLTQTPLSGIQYFPTLYLWLFQIISSTECAKLNSSQRDTNKAANTPGEQIGSFSLIISSEELDGREDRAGMRLAWKQGVHTNSRKPLAVLEHSGCFLARKHSESAVSVVWENHSQALLSRRLGGKALPCTARSRLIRNAGSQD